MAGSQSSSFFVYVEVKYGCVVTLIIFNLLLVAITLVSHHYLLPSDSVGGQYRLDGGLQLARLQAKSKTLNSTLQYVEDAVFPIDTADVLQRILDVISETNLVLAVLSIQRRLKFFAHRHLMPHFFNDGKHLKNPGNFVYLGANHSFLGDQYVIETKKLINLSSSAFGHLRERTLVNRNLKICTKLAV